MLNNTPPSHKKNDWLVILLGFFIFFCVSYISVLAISWSWLSQSGSFKDHLTYIVTLAKLSQLPSYISFLEEENLILDFYLHILLPIVPATLVSTCLVYKYLYVSGGSSAELLAKGPRLLTSTRQSSRLAKQYLKKEKAENGLLLHPDIPISKLREKRNIGLFGMPGSGKSVIVKYLLSQIEKDKQHIFIFDEKKEYTEILFDEHSALIAPWDSRSMRWNAAKDLDTESKIHNFANMIIADKDKPFWHQSAVELFTALVISLHDNNEFWTWRDFIDLTKLEDTELKALISEYRPQLSRFIQKNNETSNNVLMNLISNIGWIQQLANIEVPTAKPFSIMEYINGETIFTKVIVQSDNRYRSLSAPYFSALFSVFCTEYLSNGGIYNNSCWLVLDEFGNLPKTEALHEWLSTGREHEARTIIGTQSVHQIYELYGRDKTNSLLSMCGNLICLAMSSTGEDSTFFSNALGEQTVERPNNHTKNKDSLPSWQKDKKSVVEASDLANLPAPDDKGVMGYLYVNGFNAVFRLAWPYPSVKKIAQRSVIKDTECDVDEFETPDRIKRRRMNKC